MIHYNMKYLLSLLCILILNSFAFSQWHEQASGTNQMLSSVHFVDSLTGWVVGTEGTVLHTSDGGNTWEQQTSNTNTDLTAVYFAGATAGCIAGASGVILWTDNGGVVWEEVNSGTTQYLQDVFLVSDMEGWIVGGDQTILHTTDGGLTWETQGPGTGNYLLSVWFNDPMHGWASGSTWPTGGNHYILKTVDGGENWIEVPVPFAIYNLHKLFFLDNQRGWAFAGDPMTTTPFGQVLHTEDGGDTWTDIFYEFTYYLYSGYFANDTVGWTVGSFPLGAVHKTTDGGFTWENDSLAGSWGFISQDICFVGRHGWIVGQGGKIYHTDSGVVTGSAETEKITNESFFSVFPNPCRDHITLHIELQVASKMRIEVIDPAGRNTILSNGELPPGKHEFDLETATLRSGIHFLKVETKQFKTIEKILVIDK